MILSDVPLAEAKHFPDCCLAISQKLLERLTDELPHSPATTLSIGSGTGFLEAALLQYARTDLDIRGVEVSASVNKYLPQGKMLIVNGTWDLHPEASSADAWIFVYPREPRLLSTYIEKYARDSLVNIVWLGPKSDWPDYQGVLSSSSYTWQITGEQEGMAGYETMAIARRSS